MPQRLGAFGMDRTARPDIVTRASTMAQWLQPVEILLEVDARSREQVLHAAADLVGRSQQLSQDRIYDALWRREQAGSTALTGGFAIPHARIPGIARPSTAFLRLRTPIDFGASDGLRVSHVLVILVPCDGSNDDHLQMLGIVARLFSDRRFCKQIGRAADAHAAASAFTTGIDRVLVW